ncbi:nucleoside triphosphate pyrophosphohydrolase [Nitrosopumilus sp.]|nr:nucleoside triphosphate pyrophosphohydrolase [Nitrosopumilus sp.]MDB4839855.1 nucleoside triphosphate pyrophosphohydrolase [Nitrosopumilus sp.]
MIKYNKAIRDKIPEIIAESGKKCNTKQLDDESFLAELEKKLIEEVNEYTESKDVEELADLLEVIYRISELRGINSDELDEIRKDKAGKRGKFDSNLFLIDSKKS